MAREKKAPEEQGVNNGWMNTFADLMNLLLCFFVLLFSMSTVDADKYEQLVTSMSERISIFDGGGKAVGEGAFVSSGTDQLVSIAQYFKEFEYTGEDTVSKEDQETKTDGDARQDGQQSKGNKPLNDNKGSQAGNGVSEEELQAQQAAKDEKQAKQLYEQVSEDAQKKDIDDQINVNIDKKNQYVQISMNGALLFETGDSTIKKSMKPLMSKVGDILKKYEEHMIKIEGHTDNVPISSKYNSNQLLSMARANTVFEYLYKKKGISPAHMETSGRGEYDPVASNKTAKGRAQNRRVEIKIYTDK